MKLKIIASLSDNSLTMRQIEKELTYMAEVIPSFAKHKIPSRNPIMKVAYSLAPLNVHQSISFLNAAKELLISFDGSTKLATSIQAILVIHELGTAHALESFATCHGESEALAHSFG
jgi:hypothetical protein